MEDLLRTLIEFPSVTGDASVDTALTYIASFVGQRGMHVKQFRSGGFGSLVATTRADSKHTQLFLAAHLDVVPGSKQLFNLRKQDSRLLGRGVFDMKFAIAAYLEVVDRLQDKLADYDFGIMITTDEETGGENGVKYLLDEGYGAEVCLLPDGADGWHIEASAKGAWVLQAETRGKAAHGSRPWEGDSAVEKLLTFLAAAREQIPPAKEHTNTTMVVSTLQAGEAANQVPDYARATLDIRYLNNQAGEELHQALRTHAKAYDVQLSTKMSVQAIQLDVNQPLVQTWEAIVCDVRGKACGEYSLSFGASDARFFSDYGILTIVTRPDGGGAHGDDEWIDVQGLHDFAECVLRYVQTVAKAQ